MPPGPNYAKNSASFSLRDSESDPTGTQVGTNTDSISTPERDGNAGSWTAFLNGPYERVQISTIPLTLDKARQLLHPAGFHSPSNISFTPLHTFPLHSHSPPLGSSQSLFNLFGHPGQASQAANSDPFSLALDAVIADNASTSSFTPPFSQNLVVDLPIHQPVVLPPPPDFSGFLTVEKFPWNDFSDGGRVSNALALPLLVIHITHIDEKWTRIFLYAWNEVFHATHTSQPPSNLLQNANHALSHAYDRWEQERPNDPLEFTPVTIEGIAMTAIRHYEAPSPFKELLKLFNQSFKSVIRKARQANANHLLRCTLGALVACKVVPFLPLPHIDINPPQSNSATIVPRAYTSNYKDFFERSVDWNAEIGCPIWHKSDGQSLLWFGNTAVRDFLAALLSPDESSAYTLGVRRARRGPRGLTTSWAPITELDNHAVLALLAKILASLSTSILADVVQRPRQLPFDTSDGHRNRLITERTKYMFAFLAALDDLSLPYPMLMHDRQEAHSQLVRLKEELGF